MPGMRQYKKDQIRAFFLAYPQATISEAMRSCGTSERTAAGVRSDMAAEGKLPIGRNSQREVVIPPPPLPPAPPIVADPPPLPVPALIPDSPVVPSTRTDEQPGQRPRSRSKPLAVPSGIIDDAALAKVASEAALFDIDFDNLDDETIRRRLLKGVISLAFRPGVHPDTQLAATQVWVKLKDMARAKELGPGKPKSRAEAIKRLTEMLSACGPEIAIEAMTIAFNIKEPADAPSVETAPPVGTAEAPIPPGHVDPPAQDEELRAERVGPSGLEPTAPESPNPA